MGSQLAGQRCGASGFECAASVLGSRHELPERPCRVTTGEELVMGLDATHPGGDARLGRHFSLFLGQGDDLIGTQENRLRVRAPLQPMNVAPGAAVAVRVTSSSSMKLVPPGLTSTVPSPLAVTPSANVSGRPSTS